MPHPLCDSCGQRPAVVFITQITDDTSAKHRFCEQCAREKARGEGWLSPLVDEWETPQNVSDALENEPLEDVIEDVMMELFEAELAASEPDAFADAFDSSDDFDGADWLFSPLDEVNLDEFLRPGHHIEPSLRCARCNTAWETVKSQGRAGCAACYGAFRDQIGDVMGRVQRGAAHEGKAPRAAQKRVARLEQLRKRRDNQLEMLRNRLKEAVAQENYEDAAQLRDKIKIVSGTVV